MKFAKLFSAALALMAPCSVFSVQAEQKSQSDKPQAGAADPNSPEFVVVPFIFSTETLSTAFGAAGLIKHAGQPQASVLGIGLYSSNDSWASYLAVNNYQLPKLDRWLFSAELYNGSYKQGIYYLPQSGVNPAATQGEDVGRVVTQGDESYSRLHMQYVLPWGKGAHGAAASLQPSRQDVSWNPLESGVTSLQISPFVRTQELLGYESLPDETKGLEFQFEWDNRNNGKNSTQGGQTTLLLKRDFGSDDRQSWTTWEFEQSAFFSIGQNDWFGQQVLAFDYYVADTPTWNEYDSNSQTYQRPPSFAGVSLGGFERLRGYSNDRFTGRSAILYTAEYRVQPRWQPLQEWPVFNLYDLPWWQWVLFAEAGNVADEFSVEALHDDLKWSVGVGARFEVEDVVVRVELAFSEETSQVWVMVNQPF